MLPRLRGGRGRGNRGRVARLEDIGQPRRSLSDHPERVDDISVSGGEHADSTSAGVSGAYPAAPQPQPIPVPPELEHIQLFHSHNLFLCLQFNCKFHLFLSQSHQYLSFKLMPVWEL